MSIVTRVKNILLQPAAEWAVIAEETPDFGGIITGYVLPLAAIPAVAAVLNSIFFSIVFTHAVVYGMVMAVIAYVSSVAGIVISAFIVDALAPTFASEKSTGRALQLVAYSATPWLVASILSILPFVGIIAALIGLYGIYLMYLGMPVMMRTPQDKVVVYMIVAFVLYIAVFVMVNLILAGILLPIFGLSMLAGAGF